MSDLAAIRERDAEFPPHREPHTRYEQAVTDRRALLAHIDALAEAVEGLESDDVLADGDKPSEPFDAGFYAGRAAVLAILEGKDAGKP